MRDQQLEKSDSLVWALFSENGIIGGFDVFIASTREINALGKALENRPTGFHFLYGLGH